MERKRTVCWLIVICFMMLFPLKSVKAQEIGEGKALYVVYDNSLSMKDTDAWREAAYAMETIVAMMDKGDTLTIYFMEDEGKHYTKKGLKKAQYNQGNLEGDFQEEVYNALSTLIYTSNTHIDGLKQAITDIKNDDSGLDKWLLVLSDGVFNYEKGDRIGHNTKIDLDQELPGIHTIYFGMGSESKDIIANAEKEFYASDGNILSKFTEVANYIYERQTISFTKDGNKLSFELELPAKRLIVMAQTEGKSISEDQVQGEIGKEASVSYHSLKNETDNAEAIDYYAAVKIYKTDSLISCGFYEVTVPEDTEVTVYVEYEVQYALQLIQEESNIIWELDKEEPAQKFREGTYVLEVKFRDAETEEIIEDADIYNKLQVDLKLSKGDSIRENRKEMFLAEGNYTITGKLNLEGNYPKNIDESFEIGHKLGKIELQTIWPEKGFDIDVLEEKKEAIFVSVLEDEENISDLANLKLQVEEEAKSPYHYQSEKIEGGWSLYPIRSDNWKEKGNLSGESSLKLTVSGERDEESILASKEYEIFYFASPQKITFDNILINEKDIANFWIHRKIKITPLINGKNIDITTEISGIESSIKNFQGLEGMRADMKILSSNPLQLELVFYGIPSFQQMMGGGTLLGEIQIDLTRYQAQCSGSNTFRIIIGRMTTKSLVLIVILGALAILLVIYIIFNVLVKAVCKTRFWLFPVNVQCATRYGEEVDVIEIAVKKHRVRNFFRLLHPRIVVPLNEIQYLGFSTSVPGNLIIERRARGKGVVVNIEEFVFCEYVRKNGKKLIKFDALFDWERGLQWELLGTYNVKIRISSKGRD